MTTEYLRRNMAVAKAAGAHANAKSAINRLHGMKHAPHWIVRAFEGIRDRTADLPSELAVWRDTAKDRPAYVAAPPVQTWPACNRWAQAIDETLVVSCLDCTTPDEDPRKALARLIEWSVQIALDPAVSSSAQALIDRGRAEAIPSPAGRTS